MTNKNIFVACDTSSLKEIKKIINDTKTNKLQIIFKKQEYQGIQKQERK